jgi:hypothetical protein
MLTQQNANHRSNYNWLLQVKQTAYEVYYCAPLEDGLRIETCSGSNDRKGEGGLLLSWYNSEVNYLVIIFVVSY